MHQEAQRHITLVYRAALDYVKFGAAGRERLR